MLSFVFLFPSHFPLYQAALTMDALAALARLTQLTDLRLERLSINLAVPVATAEVMPMPSVQTLRLHYLGIHGADPATFCRTFSAHFPALCELDMLHYPLDRALINDDEPNGGGFEGHLFWFANLRKHRIRCSNYAVWK